MNYRSFSALLADLSSMPCSEIQPQRLRDFFFAKNIEDSVELDFQSQRKKLTLAKLLELIGVHGLLPALFLLRDPSNGIFYASHLANKIFSQSGADQPALFEQYNKIFSATALFDCQTQNGEFLFSFFEQTYKLESLSNHISRGLLLGKFYLIAVVWGNTEAVYNYWLSLINCNQLPSNYQFASGGSKSGNSYCRDYLLGSHTDIKLAINHINENQLANLLSAILQQKKSADDFLLFLTQHDNKVEAPIVLIAKKISSYFFGEFFQKLDCSFEIKIKLLENIAMKNSNNYMYWLYSVLATPIIKDYQFNKALDFFFRKKEVSLLFENDGIEIDYIKVALTDRESWHVALGLLLDGLANLYFLDNKNDHQTCRYKTITSNLKYFIDNNEKRTSNDNINLRGVNSYYQKLFSLLEKIPDLNLLTAISNYSSNKFSYDPIKPNYIYFAKSKFIHLYKAQFNKLLSKILNSNEISFDSKVRFLLNLNVSESTGKNGVITHKRYSAPINFKLFSLGCAWLISQTIRGISTLQSKILNASLMNTDSNADNESPLDMLIQNSELKPQDFNCVINYIIKNNDLYLHIFGNNTSLIKLTARQNAQANINFIEILRDVGKHSHDSELLSLLLFQLFILFMKNDNNNSFLSVSLNENGLLNQEQKFIVLQGYIDICSEFISLIEQGKFTTTQNVAKAILTTNKDFLLENSWMIILSLLKHDKSLAKTINHTYSEKTSLLLAISFGNKKALDHLSPEIYRQFNFREVRYLSARLSLHLINKNRNILCNSNIAYNNGIESSDLFDSKKTSELFWQELNKLALFASDLVDTEMYVTKISSYCDSNSLPFIGELYLTIYLLYQQYSETYSDIHNYFFSKATNEQKFSNIIKSVIPKLFTNSNESVENNITSLNNARKNTMIEKRMLTQNKCFFLNSQDNFDSFDEKKSQQINTEVIDNHSKLYKSSRRIFFQPPKCEGITKKMKLEDVSFLSKEH